MTTLELMENLPEIVDRIERAEIILLGLDFDGTLTPLRQHPDDAVLSEPVRALLDRLARVRGLTLMIVSGRGLTDVAGRVELPGLVYAGNHGLEIKGLGFDFVEPTAASLADQLRELTRRLEPRLTEIPGALVEMKGLTTSVHYRNVPPKHTDRLARIVRETVEADSTRFVLSTGHDVWEIRPPVRWHKGDAILWVMRQLKVGANPLVFFLGDDRTDEDAFASLPDQITVRVGSSDHPTQARFRLPDPAAVQVFLEWLAKRLT